MRLIQNMIIINLKNDRNEYMLINSLYGNIDIIDKDEVGILSRWTKELKIIPESQTEKILYDQLSQKKYLVENFQVENNEKDKIINKLALLHKKNNKGYGNVVLLLSYDCNFNCPYCYEQDYTDSLNTKIMTEDMVDKIFEINDNKMDSVMFYGGEPFLPANKNIIEYVLKKAPKATYSAFTNGYYLEEFESVFKDVNLNFLQVTLDGPKEMHNKMRHLKNGEPTYDKIMQGVELFLKRGTLIRFRMNLTNENISACIRLREELIKKFSLYKDLIVFELQPIFQLNEEIKSEMYKKMYNLDFYSDSVLPAEQMNRLYTSEMPIVRQFLIGEKMRPKYTFCNACDSSRYYDVNGDIFSCILSVGQAHKAIGKYFPYNDENEKSMVKRNIATVNECKECKYSLLCGGGCPNGIIDQTGDALKPNCYNIKEQLYKKIPYLYNLKMSKNNE